MKRRKAALSIFWVCMVIVVILLMILFAISDSPAMGYLY